MLRRVLAAWCGLFLAAPSASVELRASEPIRRVVLLQSEPALERALSTALGPWGMALSRAPDGAAQVLPLGSAQAAALARRMRADALVWLAPAASERKLWVYDGDSGVLSARDVPPTLDETRAAALALSVKTELRATGVTGEEAGAESGLASGDTSSPSSVVSGEIGPPSIVPGITSTAVASTTTASTTLASTTLASAAGPSGAGASETAPQASPLVSSAEPEVSMPVQSIDVPSAEEASTAVLVPERQLSLLVHAALRTGATSRASVDRRYAAEMRWQLSAAQQAEVWAGARFDLGLPEVLSTPAFRGHYSELGGGLELGAALHVTAWLAFGAHVAASMYAGTISGTRSLDGADTSSTRFGYTLQLRPEMELSGGRIGLVIQPALGAAPFRQLYEVNGAAVLELRPVWWQLGAALRVDLN